MLDLTTKNINSIKILISCVFEQPNNENCSFQKADKTFKSQCLCNEAEYGAI